MVRTIFATVVVFSIVSSIQSCAPYFSSSVTAKNHGFDFVPLEIFSGDAWKALKDQSSNMSNVSPNCKSAYVDLAASTVFTGQQFCTDIFATKLFLAKACSLDCQAPKGNSVSLSTINCNTYKYNGDGEDPIDNVFQFQCIYTKNGVPSAPCTSKEYNFQQVIDGFSSKCLATATSTITSVVSTPNGTEPLGN